MKHLSLFVALFALSGCSGLYLSHGPISATEQDALTNPPAYLVADIKKYAPELVAYNLEVEAIALKHGRPLNDLERADAIAAGVQHPERIRIYITDDIPGGDRPTLFSEVGAITARYGIFVRPQVAQLRGPYREVIVHEFVHVAQFERLGIEGMAERTLLEYSVLDNKLVPLEREAIAIGETIYDDPDISYGF